MKVHSLITTITASANRSAGKTKKAPAKIVAKQTKEILENEAMKRKTLECKELKILPEYNFFGLPMWM